jgi:hypothetical protein
MFLTDLTLPMNIKTHLMFPDLVDIHKLYISVFKSRNVFLDMNIGSKKHKKAEKRMHFSCSVAFAFIFTFYKLASYSFPHRKSPRGYEFFNEVELLYPKHQYKL